MENFATEKNRYFRLGKSNYKNAITHFQWKSEEEDGVPNNLFGIQDNGKRFRFNSIYDFAPPLMYTCVNTTTVNVYTPTHLTKIVISDAFYDAHLYDADLMDKFVHDKAALHYLHTF